MKIECRAPLRIDLAGGWSDIPPFAAREGGAVLNVAIAQYVTGDIRSTRAPDRDRGSDADKDRDRGSDADKDRSRGSDGDNGDKDRDQSLRVSYGLDLPAGAGLGSSASLSVAWLALIHANMGATLDQKTLAREACDLAALLGLRGGKQDEYAAALGGVNLMIFRQDHDIDVRPLELSASRRAELEERLVLCYSGSARLSGDIHERVWGAYERGDAAVGRTLGLIRDMALEMSEALAAGNMAAVAACMRRNWEAQKRLHPSITNARVDALFDAADAAGVLAGKACGAGGGGCLVFLAEPARAPAVRAALAAAGARLIDARIDWDGVMIQSSL